METSGLQLALLPPSSIISQAKIHHGNSSSPPSLDRTFCPHKHNSKKTMTYRLSSTLSGHEQDVKSVASAQINDLPIIVSVSRDATTRKWHQVNRSSSTDSQIIFNSPSSAFLNSTAIIATPQGHLVASGCQDGMIYVNDLHEDSYYKGDGDCKYQLIGHGGNVCALSFAHGQLISSSWDSHAIVWNLEDMSTKYVLKGHESSVWDAKIVAPDQYLTAGADKTIRLWNFDHEVLKFVGHTDVVRKLAVLPHDKKEFVSCSNDGTIRVWNLQTGENTKVLRGHESFVYDVALLPDGKLVSTGEDRTVHVWDLDSGKVVQVITLPCISVWCVTVLPNGDFAVGGSDKLIRVFTQNQERVASASELEEFTKAVESSSISEQSLDDLKKTDIPSIDVLRKPGKKEGATIMVKTAQGTIEAHQWSGGAWHKIGDVVGGASSSSSKKSFNGKEYDYVFDVDIKDGAPPLKLPFNLNENPYTVAEKFLADNELPSSYTEEVVRFLETNTAGASLQESFRGNAGAEEVRHEYLNDPYSDAYTRTHQESKTHTHTSVLPVLAYMTFDDYKKDTILKGLQKLNSAEEEAKHKLTELEISQIDHFLSNPSSSQAAKIVTDYAYKIIYNWKPASALIGFDLLRISLPKITTVDLISSTDVAQAFDKEIERGLQLVTSSNPALLMMICKSLCNTVGTTLFLQSFVDPQEDGSYEYNSIFKTFSDKLGKIATTVDTSHKLYGSLMTALASFAYDLSVYQLKTPGMQKNPQVAAEPVLQFLHSIGDNVVHSSSEAAYRLAVAYGNLKCAKACTSTSPPPSWILAASELYVSKGETRFVDLAKDIKSLH
ncbi:uncharacterized protein LODBEIA_P06130 [Lodderomyces beijingensis]|uniref:Protein DOA1 n=1 Tax=Lodderomyces beijingensis TaxID=1775926 RepID=A0ABP0ZDY1_9ASCO